MRRCLLALAVIASCHKPKPAEDWTRTPFKTIDASAGGVLYTISIPETWESRKPAADGWGAKAGPFVTVENVSQDLATSAETAIANAGMSPEQVVRKESKADGFHLTETHDETLIHVAVYLKVGGSFLYCNAMQSSEGGIPRFDTTKQALVKICESIVVK